MVMNLSHYSPTIITSLNPVDFRHSSNGKPSGFWVSVDGEYDWKWWCESEDFCLGNLTYRHEVILNDNHNILMLEDLHEFTDEYSYLPDHFKDSPIMRNSYIDWFSVSKKYDGIIIAPYRWNERLTLSWYYGWDCASGCIWNIDSIKEIKLINN